LVEAGLARDAATAALGVVTGALSGAFGVGGAVLSTPGIRALGVAPLIAVGSTLPSVLPSAISGSLRYHRERLIDWRAVRLTLPTGLVAAVAGAALSDVVPGNGHLLMVVTASLLAFTAYRMYASARRSQTTTDADEDVPEPGPGGRQSGEREGPLSFALVGSMAGLFSGLLGIGGGVVMVPAFHSIAGMKVKAAIATSLVCVAGFAVPGTITHAIKGNIDWRVAGALTLFVIPGARIGSALTMKSNDVRLRLAVALFLGVISIIYAAGELAALR
jgi:uncharacterized membrane protein YfcA